MEFVFTFQVLNVISVIRYCEQLYSTCTHFRETIMKHLRLPLGSVDYNLSHDVPLKLYSSKNFNILKFLFH